MKKLLLFFSLPLLLLGNDSFQLSWDYLSKHVKFTEKYNKEVDMLLLYPTFTETIKKMNGRRSSIKGYMIPSDPKAGIYILSKYPMAQCYFCGGAGPETIVEVQLKNKTKRYKTDYVATVSGVFKLNGTDVEHCNYILEEAVVVK